jgi:hypothetical protein
LVLKNAGVTAAESDGSTPLFPRDPHAKVPSRDYLKRAATPRSSPTRALAARAPCAAAAETLAATASGFRRRRRPLAAVKLPGDAQGGEAPAGVACCRSRAPCRPRNLAGVRVLRRRVDHLRRRVSAKAAALDRSAVLRASRRGRPRLKSWPGALDWGLVGELAAQRRRSRSPPAQHRRPPLAVVHGR